MNETQHIEESPDGGGVASPRAEPPGRGLGQEAIPPSGTVCMALQAHIAGPVEKTAVISASPPITRAQEHLRPWLGPSH